MTAVITAERGREQLTRHGLEEYVSDCVILLDHRVNDQIATRHLRVVKYRGALHGTNEFPFLIGNDGFSVLPITSLGLNHKVSNERISTGIPRLDAMLGGRGFFRGSSILLTGTPGTGKTIIAACFAQAAARRGERVLFFSFEESPNQIIRNMRSIGLRLEPLVKRGLLRFHSARPTLYGLEMHLATMFKEIAAFQPARRHRGPDHQPDGRGHRPRDQGDGDAADRLSEGRTSHLALHQPDARRPRAATKRDRHVLAHGLLAVVAGLRRQRRTQSRALRAQSARHGALEPGPRIPDFRPGHRPRGRLHRSQRRLDRRRPARRRPRAKRPKRWPASRKPPAASANWNANARRSNSRSAGLRSEYETEAVELRRIDEQVGTRTRVLTAERSGLGPPAPGGCHQDRRPRADMAQVESATMKTKLWQLRLYVAGQTPKSLAAFSNLKEICETHLDGQYRIEVIDLLRAAPPLKGDQILATPHARAQAAAARAQDHRRPVGRQSRPHRLGPASGRLSERRAHEDEHDEPRDQGL